MIPYSVKTKAADASNEQTSSKQELEQKQIENSNEEQKEGAEVQTESAPLELEEVQLVEAKAVTSTALSQLKDLQQQLREAIKRRGMKRGQVSTASKTGAEIAELLLKIQKI